MRSRLLSLALLLLAAVPALAQDPGAGAADPPRAGLAELVPTEDAALKNEVAGALQRISDGRDLARRDVLKLAARKDTLHESLEALDSDLAEFRAAYGDDDDRPPAPSLADVASRLRHLQREVEAERNTTEEERGLGMRSRIDAALEDAQQEQHALASRYEQWTLRARDAVPEGEWSEANAVAWASLRETHASSLQSLIDELGSALSLLNDCRTLRGQIRARQESTILLLRRENLLVRGRSDITVTAIGQGVMDATDAPRWLSATVAEAVAAVRTGRHTGDLARWAVSSLLAMLLLAFARRRVRRRYRPAEELATEVERSKDLLWRLLGPIVWGTALAVPFLLAPRLLEALPSEWVSVSETLGFSVGLLWIGLAFVRRVLPPGDAWSPMDLDVRSRMLVRTGLLALLWISGALVPLGIVLSGLGYDNAGALQALWTLYKLLAVVVLLLFVLRRGVLLSFLPSGETVVGRLLRGVVSVIHPVLVLVGPLLLALDFLQYDVLAEFLLRLIGGVLVAGAAGFFVFRGTWKGLSAWIRSAVTEPADGSPEESRVDAALQIGRYLLLLSVLVGSLLVLVLVRGGDLAGIHDVLDVDLPFQSNVAGPHVTWFDVIAGLVLVVLFLTAVPKLKLVLERFVLPRTSLDSGVRYTISTLVGYVFAALGIYIGFLQVFDLGALGYVFAALSVGIGFGLQEIVSNFVSGLILLFERPIKVGDLITVGGTEGWVTRINIRATTIQTRDNISMLIPNKDFITQAVVNSVYGDPIIRLHVTVGVAYGSDTQLVRKILEDVGRAHPRTLASRPVEAFFLGFGESSLDFEVRVWIPEASEHPRIASDLRFAIDAAFRENGVEIPFPQRDLHLRTVTEAAATRLSQRDGRN